MIELETVQHDWTNAPIETILFNEIILLHWNNIKVEEAREKDPFLVQRLETIIKEEQSSEIAKYIFKKIVFTAASLPRNKDLAKSTVYYVVKELERLGVIEKTKIRAVNPDPTYTGPKARFYKLQGYEIKNGFNDPLIQRAQLEYTASFLSSPEHIFEQSNRVRLTNISTTVIDHYTEKHLFGNYTPSLSQLLDYIETYHPILVGNDRAEIIQKVRHTLQNTKEAAL
jgi:hypothetical protein